MSCQAMVPRTCSGRIGLSPLFSLIVRPLRYVQKLVAAITGVRPKRTVDPDKAVALGAATYAGILEGEVRRCPFGFRIGLMNQFMESMKAVYLLRFRGPRLRGEEDEAGKTCTREYADVLIIHTGSSDGAIVC